MRTHEVGGTRIYYPSALVEGLDVSATLAAAVGIETPPFDAVISGLCADCGSLAVTGEVLGALDSVFGQTQGPPEAVLLTEFPRIAHEAEGESFTASTYELDDLPTTSEYVPDDIPLGKFFEGAEIGRHAEDGGQVFVLEAKLLAADSEPIHEQNGCFLYRGAPSQCVWMFWGESNQKTPTGTWVYIPDLDYQAQIGEECPEAIADWVGEFRDKVFAEVMGGHDGFAEAG